MVDVYCCHFINFWMPQVRDPDLVGFLMESQHSLIKLDVTVLYSSPFLFAFVFLSLYWVYYTVAKGKCMTDMNSVTLFLKKKSHDLYLL